MSFAFPTKSIERLKTVHPDLSKVAYRALEHTKIGFIITDGLRTKEKQLELVKSGASKTLNSRHLTGHAIDVAAIMNEKISWDWAYYELIAKAMNRASMELGIPIIWGGIWKDFKDGVHFELDRATYK